MLIHAHSGLRWILLLLLLVTIVKAFSGWKGDKVFGKSDNMLSVMTMGFLHLQVVLGLVLYFVGPKAEVARGMSDMMGNSFARFWLIEHFVGMIIAAFFITMGRIRLKKLSVDAIKHKTVFIYYLIGLILILASIPWPFRNVGGGWF